MFLESRLDLAPIRQAALGRCRRRGHPEVGRVVRQSRVDLVADPGDDGNPRPCDRADDRLLVEAPEVFHRPTATAENDHVRRSVAIQIVERRRDVFGRSLPLHATRPHEHPTLGEPLLENLEDVLQRGALGSRHDADDSRQGRQWKLPRVLEQALFEKASLPLLERLLQRSDAVGLEIVDLKPKTARRAVVVDPTYEGEHLTPVLRCEGEPRALVGPHHRLDGVLRFLQREERVAVADDLVAGHLAFEPEAVREHLLKAGLQLLHEPADRNRAASLLRRALG